MIERIRGRKLQAIRKRILTEQPLCVACLKQGRIALATEVDHVVALVNGGVDTDDNRQALCTECHKAKTGEDMGHKPQGCDARGWPTDERHHWNASSRG